MASSTTTRIDGDDERHGSYPQFPEGSFGDTLEQVLRPLASLKLTVVLLALGIFLVFVGTLAQDQRNIEYVKNHYFRTIVAEIEVDNFFPSAFFPDHVPSGRWFYYPGGFAIGGMMLLNLLAAHSLRFKVQARGRRLWAGLAVLGLGVVATAAVITVGNSNETAERVSPEHWRDLWTWMRAGMVAVWVAAAWYTTRLPAEKRVERRLLSWVTGIAAIPLLWLVLNPDTLSFENEDMRILWQLTSAALAGVVLLVGCILLFRKRAGIVLLHGGLALMMINEVLVYSLHREAIVSLTEGQTAYFARDVGGVELAVSQTDRIHQEVEELIVPQSYFSKSQGQPIAGEDLPFDVRVVEYFENSSVRPLAAGETPVVTAGLGRGWVIQPQDVISGADSSGRVNVPAMYAQIDEKDGGEHVGTYLLSAGHDADTVVVGGKPYQIDLRFLRRHKPYVIRLISTDATMYPGTQIPRDYRSEFRIIDPSRDVNRRVKVWMNNPLRFAGDTIYQSGYDDTSGQKVASFQIVANTAWMIPYVSCMIVVIGMLAQFVLTLIRFLNRRAAIVTAEVVEPSGRQRRRRTRHAVPQQDPLMRKLEWIVPAAVVGLAAIYFLSTLARGNKTNEGLDLDAFGRLPVMYQGRIQPIDTLARNSLLKVAKRETFYDSAKKRQPAIRWLLDVVSQKEEGFNDRVFKIQSTSLLDALGLERRGDDKWLYSLNDLEPHLDTIDDYARSARERQLKMPQNEESDEEKSTEETAHVVDDPTVDEDEAKAQDLFDRDVLELHGRIGTMMVLQEGLTVPGPQASAMQAVTRLTRAPRSTGEIKQYVYVRPIPSEFPEAEWEPAVLAGLRAWVQQQAAQYKIPETLSRDAALQSLADALAETTVHALPGMQDKAVDPRLQAHYSQLIQPALREAMKVKRPDFSVQTQASPTAQPNPAVEAYQAIYAAYEQDNAAAFNRAVDDYWQYLRESGPEDFQPAKVALESGFNRIAPFYTCAWLYVFAFIPTALSWLVLPKLFNRTAVSLILLALAIHTVGLVVRIYISGRPPVTNLYSSAVFIGWAAVILGLVLEWLYGKGIGNTIAAFSGFSSLLIAHYLSLDDDTFKVLQAVLDTNFWLATHVVCITLGYATTFVAGFLGLFYVVRGIATPTLSPQASKEMARSIYGILCFAIFFSFFGTVLGGLWADDSWGRFWGWDPKENGALIIVLWNALVLHARWDGWVRERGLAALAMAGNIVTAWSWFGVNQLGIGLHSYGFTDGVALALAIGVSIQLVWIVLCALPNGWWWSSQRHRPLTPEIVG